jgi:hypothetical protein
MPTLEVIDTPDLFAPNPGAQEEFLDDYSTRYCAFAGGMGAGKSHVGSRKTANLHVYNAFDGEGQPTYCASLLVAESYQLARTVNMPQLEAAFNEIGLRWQLVSDPKLYAYKLIDLGTKARPSYFYVRSAEAAAAIAGFEVGAVWGDEAARWPWAREGENPLVDAFIQADGRLRHPGARFHQFNVTYTNEGEDTRVYQDFEADPKPGRRLYRGSTRENRHLPPGYVEERVGQMSADLISQYIDGFAAKLGANLVYSNYSDARNRDGSVELVDGLPLHLSIDFNKTPGMFGCIGQFFADRDLLTTRYVLHKPGMLIKQMMHEFYWRFAKDFADRRFPILELFGDVAGRTGSAVDGRSYWDSVCAELSTYGIPYRLRLPSHAPLQVDRANSANSAFQSADGRVRWKIHPDCESLIRDFKLLKWDGNRKIDKRQKDLSHPSDADTYRCHYLMPIRRIESRAGRPAAIAQPA